MNIRGFCNSDLAALRRICLLTGHSGQSAEQLYDDPDLLGDYYAAPYARLHPEFTLILERAAQPVGYALAAPDTANFAARCETEWFPPIRQRLVAPADDDQSAEARLIRLVFAGHCQHNRFLDYPAHLHIDILPTAQSVGWGKRLILALLERLRAAGVVGVHLGVGEANQSAIGFYEHLGFTLLEKQPLARFYGMLLTDRSLDK